MMSIARFIETSFSAVPWSGRNNETTRAVGASYDLRQTSGDRAGASLRGGSAIASSAMAAMNAADATIIATILALLDSRKPDAEVCPRNRSHAGASSPNAPGSSGEA
jgi:hypothetical protein